MKKTVITIIILVAIAAAAFFYFTRPVDVVKTQADTAAVTEHQLETPTSTDETLYRIKSDNAKVSFSITEELHGSPFTAVGTSSDISGDVIVNTKDAIVKMGTITIDARTFKTDSTQRDGAISRFIVKTDTNPYITFVPTSIYTLPATMTLGKEFSFAIDGDLTLAGVTKPETIMVKGVQTADSFSGTISTTLKRSDFGLTIPNIPFVANVSDTFTISGTISAAKVQ